MWSKRSPKANSQQAAGISQLNDAVAQLDQITRQNAAGQMMYEQSERLAATVSYFAIHGRTGNTAAPVGSGPRAAVPAQMNEPRYEEQPRADKYGT